MKHTAIYSSQEEASPAPAPAAAPVVVAPDPEITQELREKLSECNSTILDLRAETEVLKDKLREQQEHLEVAQDLGASLRSDLREQKDKYTEAETKIEELQKQLGDKEKQEELEERVEQLITEKEALTESLDEAKVRLKKWESILDQVQTVCR